MEDGAQAKSQLRALFAALNRVDKFEAFLRQGKHEEEALESTREKLAALLK